MERRKERNSDGRTGETSREWGPRENSESDKDHPDHAKTWKHTRILIACLSGGIRWPPAHRPSVHGAQHTQKSATGHEKRGG